MYCEKKMLVGASFFVEAFWYLAIACVEKRFYSDVILSTNRHG